MEPRNRLPLLPLIGIVIFALLGLALLFWPQFILSLFPILIGAILMVVGGLWLVYAFATLFKTPDSGLKFIQGALALLVGIVFLAKRDISIVFLSILFGLYALVSAVVDLSGAIQNLRAKKSFGSELVGGLFGLALGFLILFSPFSGSILWVRLLGVYFLIAAITSLFMVLPLFKRTDALPESSTSEPENPPNDNF